MISAHTEGSWHQSGVGLSPCKEKRKNRWKSREWVQPEVKTRARQLKKHISREFCRAVTQCHESKTNSEARFDHKCVSPFTATVVKALDCEDSAEHAEQKTNLLQTYYKYIKKELMLGCLSGWNYIQLSIKVQSWIWKQKLDKAAQGSLALLLSFQLHLIDFFSVFPHSQPPTVCTVSVKLHSLIRRRQ